MDWWKPASQGVLQDDGYWVGVLVLRRIETKVHRGWTMGGGKLVVGMVWESSLFGVGSR